MQKDGLWKLSDAVISDVNLYKLLNYQKYIFEVGLYDIDSWNEFFLDFYSFKCKN